METTKTSEGNAGTGKSKEKKARRKTLSRSLLKARELLLVKVLPQLAHHDELKSECQEFAEKVLDKFVEEERGKSEA